MESYDVAIIGFGPVGALAANVLGMYHVRTVVIEREVQPYDLPRAIVLDDEVMRILQQVGLSEEILPLTKEIVGEQFLARNRQLLFTAELASSRNGYASTYAFYQPHLESVLRQGVERFSQVKVYSGCTVNALSQDEAWVTVTMQTSGGKIQELQARYILGCDGARSITRAMAGLRLRDLKFHQAWLVVDAILKEDGERGGETAYVQQYCSPVRPETFVPSVGRHRRWEFMLVQGETKEEMVQQEKVKALLSSWIDPGDVEIIRASVYTFHALMAEHWRKERLFLLGDAAHQMPPFLGQGMCTGMRDVANLCWKLYLVLCGQAREQLLESYEQERRSHARIVVDITVLIGKIIQASHLGAWLRDRLLPLLARFPDAFAMQMPPINSGFFLKTHAARHSPSSLERLFLVALARRREKRAAQGILLPQPDVKISEERIARLDAVLGESFAVVGFQINPRIFLKAGELEFWESLGTRFVQLVVPGDLERAKGAAGEHRQQVIVIEDCEGIMGEWFAGHSGSIAVVRPDRYVFGIVAPERLSEATQHLCVLLQGEKLL